MEEERNEAKMELMTRPQRILSSCNATQRSSRDSRPEAFFQVAEPERFSAAVCPMRLFLIKPGK